MGNYLLLLYLTAREPRNFLRLLSIFMATWLTVHWLAGTDEGFGGLNLILSCEATIAGAVMLMQQKEQAVLQGKQLLALIAFGETQQQLLQQISTTQSEHREDVRMLLALAKDLMARQGSQA